MRLRQEVLNTALAELLTQRGIEATPERVLQRQGRHMPDVMATLHGLRVIVEAEIDIPGCELKALESARERVSSGVANVAVALIYPVTLARQSSVKRIKELMLDEDTGFRVSVVTELGDTPFVSGGFEYLLSVLQESWTRLLHEDVLAETVSQIDSAVTAFADVADRHPAIISKLAGHLGIQGPPDRAGDEASE